MNESVPTPERIAVTFNLTVDDYASYAATVDRSRGGSGFAINLRERAGLCPHADRGGKRCDARCRNRRRNRSGSRLIIPAHRIESKMLSATSTVRDQREI